MTWLLILAAVAVGAWWFGKQSSKPAPTQPLTPSLPVYEDYQDEIERKPVEELDGDEQEVRKAFATFERQHKARSDSYHAKKAAIASDEQKLVTARKFIETAHLDLALPYVQDETRHWPSWSKLPEDRGWTAPMLLTDIDGTTSAAKETWVQFRAGGSLFRLDMQESRMPADDNNEFAKMQLSVDGQEVLGMGVMRDWTKEYDRWRFVSVDCLRVGPWMTEFVEFYGKLRAIKEGTQEDLMNKYVTDRAGKVDLGGAE
jgi:hypothetical protein